MKQLNINQLNKMYDFLASENLRVTERLRPTETPTKELHSVPMVSNGADGIRFDFTPKKGFQVWFTNGFEDPNNDTRIATKAFISLL